MVLMRSKVNGCRLNGMEVKVNAVRVNGCSRSVLLINCELEHAHQIQHIHIAQDHTFKNCGGRKRTILFGIQFAQISANNTMS